MIDALEDKDWKNWTEALPVEDIDGAEDKKKPLTRPRPGHADLAGAIKYNFQDARYILERASARETTARVALGALAKALLGELGITVLSHVIQVGDARLVGGALWTLGVFFQIFGQRVHGLLQLAHALVDVGDIEEQGRALRERVRGLEFTQCVLVVALLEVSGARFEVPARVLVVALGAEGPRTRQKRRADAENEQGSARSTSPTRSTDARHRRSRVPHGVPFDRRR